MYSLKTTRLLLIITSTCFLLFSCDTEFDNRVYIESLHSDFSSSKHLKSHHVSIDSNRCNSLAVYRCGRKFISVMQGLESSIDSQVIETHCLFKEEFFACLKKTREINCQDLEESELQFFNPKFFHEEKFKKKLADTLWEARMCRKQIITR